MLQTRLKIALCVYTFKPNTGGLQAHAEQLCEQLRSKGHEVVVITRAATRFPQGRDYLFFNEAVPEMTLFSIPVRTLRFSRFWIPVLWIISKCAARQYLHVLAIKLYQFVARRPARRAFSGVDIIHYVGHGSPLVGFAALSAARYFNLPFVVQPTVHPHRNGDSPLDLRLYRGADRLLVHTRYEAQFLRDRLGLEKIDIFGNGIDERCNGDGERFRRLFGIIEPIILYIGRKDIDKGYALIVDAFQHVQAKRKDIKLICMRPAGSANRVTDQANILDLGFQSNQLRHDALAACTCLCVPSEWESFGLVYMEAGRYGKPFVARNLPVLRELFGMSKCGMLVGSPNDALNRVALTPEELALALLNLINDETRCRRLGENCRRVSGKYVWSRVIDRFELSYYTAIRQH